MLGAPARQDEKASLERSLELAWQRRDAAEATAIWTAGSKMPLEQAIRCALERSPA